MEAVPQWHMLQISDVLDEELCSALSRNVEIQGWAPEPSVIHALCLSGGVQASEAVNERFTRHTFSSLRGYARAPSWLRNHFARRLVSWISAASKSPAQDVLICTIPYFADVAELWPGPVVYWLTDLIAHYRSAHGIDVPLLDRRMCEAATLVCPNSERLAAYLKSQGCNSEKILVLPNATRRTNVLPAPLVSPMILREVEQDTRPIAGVIGNLAGNMDWLLLKAVVQRTHWLQWVFVGPVTMQIPDGEQRRARSAVQKLENTKFVGKKPYGELAEYARSFHVAVLPYLRCEPTYSGSSTRFYEHLAACRPMLATRGFEELLRKEPLLTLVDTPEDTVRALEQLRACGFDDGRAHERWIASQSGTWESRAESMQRALLARMAGLSVEKESSRHAEQTPRELPITQCTLA